MVARIDLAVIGDLNVDLFLIANCRPEYDQVEKLVDDQALLSGGSGANVACGAAKLGLSTALFSKVADDVFGRLLLDELLQSGVDTSCVTVVSDFPTGMTLVLSDGLDRAVMSYLGTTEKLTFADLDVTRISRCRHLHLSSYYLLKGLIPDVPFLLKSARQLGLTISLDTNYDPDEKWDGSINDILAYTDIFLPNETELKRIAGTKDMETALKLLCAHIPILVVKRGESGGMACSDGRVFSAPALNLDVVDTTGAGDSFDAGFIFGYLSRWDLPRSLAFASICGSLAVRAIGATSSQATIEEASGYIDQIRVTEIKR